MILERIVKRTNHLPDKVINCLGYKDSLFHQFYSFGNFLVDFNKKCGLWTVGESDPRLCNANALNCHCSNGPLLI